MTESGAPPQEGSIDVATVFREQYGFVCNGLRRLGAREADVQDLAHEVFVTFHRRLVDYDRSRPLRPWLYGICVRVAAAHRRSARERREVVSDPHEHERMSGGSNLDEEDVLLRSHVLVALDRVDERRRPVLVMHDIEGYSMPEIAHALALPLNTAYSRLRLAREDFRRAWRAFGGNDV